jgi:anti-anti-sigma factor
MPHRSQPPVHHRTFPHVTANRLKAVSRRLERCPGLAVVSANFPGLAIIAAAGNVESSTVPALRDAMRAASRAACHVMVDLGRVTFFDRAAFRACVACYRLCRRQRRTFVLVNPAPVVQTAVRMLDVQRVLTHYATAEEASYALTGRGVGPRCPRRPDRGGAGAAPGGYAVSRIRAGAAAAAGFARSSQTCPNALTMRGSNWVPA